MLNHITLSVMEAELLSSTKYKLNCEKSAKNYTVALALRFNYYNINKCRT